MAARKQPFFYITNRFSTIGIYKYKDGHKRLSGAVDICVFLEVSYCFPLSTHTSTLRIKLPGKWLRQASVVFI